MIPAVIFNWTWLKASACSVLLLLYCPSLLTGHYPSWQQQHTVIHFFCSCCHDIKRQSPLHVQKYPVFGIVCRRWCDPTQTSSCFVLLLLFSYADTDEWLNRWTHGSNLRSYLRPRFVLISRPVRCELPRNPAALPFLSAEAFYLFIFLSARAPDPIYHSTKGPKFIISKRSKAAHFLLLFSFFLFY